MQLAVMMYGTLHAPYIVSLMHRNEASTWLSLELGDFAQYKSIDFFLRLVILELCYDWEEGE